MNTEYRAAYLATPVEAWAKVELENEIDLYSQAGVEIPGDLTNNEKRQAFVMEQRAAVGMPIVDTETNEVTLQPVPPAGATDQQAPSSPETASADAPDPAAASTPTSDPASISTDTSALPPIKSYAGEQVRDVNTIVVNGRRYRDITLQSGVTHRILESDYAALPR